MQDFHLVILAINLLLSLPCTTRGFIFALSCVKALLSRQCVYFLFYRATSLMTENLFCDWLSLLTIIIRDYYTQLFYLKKILVYDCSFNLFVYRTVDKRKDISIVI